VEKVKGGHSEPPGPGGHMTQYAVARNVERIPDHADREVS
jgi:hypothetical protein